MNWLNGIQAWLDFHGLTQLTETGDKGRPPHEVEAICHSVECRKSDNPKRVPKTAIFCPDCEHALRWERKRRRVKRGGSAS